MTMTQHPTTRRPPGRPPLPPDRKRGHTVRFKLCAPELQRLERLAQDAGFPNVAEFCRHLALGEKPRLPKTDAQLARELAALRHLLLLALRQHTDLEPQLRQLAERLHHLVRTLRGKPDP